jgi:heme/copper-type cytochrome/quinol oxidase subunit 3
MWCSGSYKHIYLRGRGFESTLLGACFFNLILARRGMHVGMGIGFVGGGMRKTRDNRE